MQNLLRARLVLGGITSDVPCRANDNPDKRKYIVITSRETTMKVNLIPIGNSKGVRIPSSVIKECGFGEQIEMRVEHGVVVLAPTQRTRNRWDGAFAKMAAAKDDALLVPDTMDHDWDQEEWEW
jgi:antitoxin MazE